MPAPDTPYKTVWISTAPRTGSMWLFNVTRAILREAGRTVLPERVPQGDQEMLELARREAWVDGDPDRVWVLKTHGTLNAAIPGSRILTCLRDPRDVLVSFRRFMQSGFEPALANAEAVALFSDAYEGYPGDLLLTVDYRDIETRPAAVLGRLAEFLALSLPADATTRVAGEFSRESVRRRIDEASRDVVRRLESGGPVERGEVVLRDGRIARAFDVHTGFQTGHVSTGQSGDWRTLLSPEEKDRVHARLGDWLVRHGFPLD